MSFASHHNKALGTMIIVWTIAFFALLGSVVSAQKSSSEFSDEFDGALLKSFDASKWTAELGGGGWGNEELQYYTNKRENVRLDGKGNLEIRAVKLDGSIDLTCWYGKCLYTSARLITKQKFDFKYGRVEARIEVPSGAGVWPAFWMLGNDIDQVGWPSCGEIDVMEFIGKEPSTVYGTVHGPGYSGAKGIGGSLANGEELSKGFHVFAVEWTENEIRWFFDGKKFRTFSRGDVPSGSKWVFDHPYFIIINFAVGGRWPGSPAATTKFPQSMLIDYVRVTALRKD